ncbi:hypothetical protein [Flavobacterium psychrotrophum]|uniref:hypothetical protein n=1 Tax=Flavobacterium psychrotrophum TaxID=2294119 RepID=UPI000E312900|nr:hypothetical protein [Flavobacterium psychrotrophum]
MIRKSKSRKVHYVHIKEAAALVQRLLQPADVTFSHPGKLPDADARFEIANNEATLELDIDFFRAFPGWEVGKIIKRSYISWQGYKLNLKNVFIDGISTATGVAASSHQFTSSGFSKTKQFYRLIIPVEKSLAFHHYIEHSVYENDFGTLSSTCLKAIIGTTTVWAYYFNDTEGNYYLGMEAESRLDFEDFCDKTFALKNAMGYLMGKMEGNFGFYFAYSNRKMDAFKAFRFQAFRKSLHTIYSPVNSNPAAYIRKRHSLVDKLIKAKTLRPVSANELSVLTNKLYSSGEFTSVIMLMMESAKASLLFMPGGYAIALETISPLITDGLKKDLKPIPSKPLGKKVRLALLNALTEFKTEITDEGYQTLEGRISYLNQPTNKAKLHAPFEALGITLSPEDLKILNTRNDFLHGRVPDLSLLGDKRTDDTKTREMFYSAIRLYTLLNHLIMKWIGFDNYIVNYPKVHEKYCKVSLHEGFYRKV